MGKSIKGNNLNHNLKGIEKTDHITLWALVIGICIIPIVVRLKVVKYIAPSIFDGILATGLQTDVFTYYKWVLMIFLTIVTLSLLLFKMLAFGYKIRKRSINIAIFVLTIVTLLSGLSSEYVNISLMGVYNRHEGVISYLCYFSLLLVAANISINSKAEKLVTRALTIVVFINALIGLLSFYGKDILNIQLVKKIIVPISMLESSESMGYLTSTINNPNYVSGFFAAMVCYFLVSALFEEKLSTQLLKTGLCIISFAVLLTSLSSSGFVTLVIILPIIIAITALKLRFKQCIVIALIIAIGFSGVFSVLNHHNPRVWQETIGFFSKESKNIQSIISYKYSKVMFTKNAEAVSAGESELLQDNITNNITSEFDLPKPGVSAGTGRSYIWSNTIKLIKERPFLGYGHDTLPYYFPQNDIYKIANMGSYDYIITKPHNFYLEVAYGSGVIAFISIIILFLMHVLRKWRKILRKDIKNPHEIACFVFLLAFLVQFLFNDSIIGTSVVFWVIFGISMSYNNQYNI